MNIATVFKQSTTTSARMSTNIHSTELSTLSSINFDNNFKQKTTVYGQSHHKLCSKQIKSNVLMESNTVLNVVQELGNDRRRHRHTFGLGEAQLFKMLSSTPVEPLFINDSANSKAALNGCINNSADNLLTQYDTATSSIATVDDYENENLPPTDNNCAVTNNEDGNVEAMSSTPQRGFGTAAWNKLQRDLNSPSASCRVRAIRAMNSPANANYYNNLDATNGESTFSEEERSIEPPRTIEEVMKDVIVYVEFRSGAENRTNGIKTTIANLGAKVNDRLLRNTTHVVFKDGLQSTYNKAKSWNIPIVSILWVEACKKHLIIMDPKAYPIPNIEKYENPDLFPEKTKRQKCIQPDTLMKNLHRPIPKSKILEGLKKHNDSDSSISPSDIVEKTPPQNLLHSFLNRKTMAAPSTLPRVSQPRKSICKKLEEKPKNTIRSMFMKQLEKSQTESAPTTSNGRRCTIYTPQPMEDAKAPQNPVTPVPEALTRLRRRTTYTPQAMEETKVQTSSITPVSTSSRRKTMNVYANATVNNSTMDHTNGIDAKSQDLIQTPNSKVTDICSTTPLINSLSKTHIDQVRSSTPKTLLEEYNNTFNSKKTPMINKRRTIANITMDIIKQRIENINRNVSMNQSTTDLNDDSIHCDIKSPPMPVENTEKLSTTPATGTTVQNATQLKPLKRKLFAPPSLFPENSPLLNTSTQKTDKKTANQKRKRNDLTTTATGIEEKKAPIIKSRPVIKKPNSRRSTLFFEEAPIRKINDTKTSISSSSTLSSTAPTVKKDITTSQPGLVFTSMHQPQIDFISKAVTKLGKFQIENKVSSNTTHLISLDNRRTLNILRGLIRGVWILSYDWVVKSVELNKWQHEMDYEMRSFSKAVEVNRIERQAFGRSYRMDIFRCFDMFYLDENCTCKNLRELILLCYGKVTKNVPNCCYFITEKYQPNVDSKKLIQVHPNWILDSITSGKVQKLATYLIANTSN